MQHIGKITGIHGLKGEVVFSHHVKSTTRFKDWDCMLIELNPGSFIPFFIEAIRSVQPEEAICKFEEINSRDDAKLILNANIYTSPNYTIDARIEKGVRQFVGYTVFNDGQELGIVTDAIEAPMNDMLVIMYQQKEVYLPSNRELIDHVDHNKKQILMNLPDGLLEL